MQKFIVAFVITAALAVAVPALAQENDPIAVLKSDASYGEKEDACRALQIKGGPEAVPALEALLVDEKLSHMARYALEPMPCPEAGTALRGALGTTSGRLKIGVISSLALRDDEQAVPEFIKLLSDADPMVANAAAEGLGKIANADSILALTQTLTKTDMSPGSLRAVCEGLFTAAETVAKEGKPGLAIKIYDRLLEVRNGPRQIRTAALRGAVLTRGAEQGLPILVKALREEDDGLFTGAIRASRELEESEKVSAALAGELAGLSAERKVPLLQALGQRGGTAAGPAVLAEAKTGPTEVRVAAIRALTRMGYAPALELVAALAGSEDEKLAQAARDSLSYFPGEAGDAALEAMLENPNAEVRRIAIESIGQGGLHEPANVLMKVVEADQDETIRVAALKALEDHAGLAEMPGLLGRLLKAQSPAEMQAAEDVLKALCARQKGTATGDVVIQKAVYGDLPNGLSADVTNKVAEIVKAGSLSIGASNANFGDPAPGTAKRLLVDYTENGTPISKTARENEALTLTTASVPAAVVDALRSALGKAQGDTKLAVLRVLGTTGSREALETVRALASGGEGKVKETALRTLCEWPNADVLSTVMELVKTSPDPTLKTLALRGAVRLLKQGDAEAAELLRKYALLMDQAGAADEKKLVLSGLAQVAHVDALEMALAQVADDAVKAEAVQAAIAVAKGLGGSAGEEKAFFNGNDLTGWEATTDYWRVEDGAIVGHSAKRIPDTAYIWSGVEVRDFYLSVEVKLEPVTANSGVQFRSKKIDDAGHALGCQGDIGQDVWGRLYHQGGRGKLDWNGRAEAAVKPGEWNRVEVLAVGPAIWTAINGKLGVACLDLAAKDERSGLIGYQIHVGPPQTVRFRSPKLVHNPKVELGRMKAEELIAELRIPE